jgi:hypothetical protein
MFFSTTKHKDIREDLGAQGQVEKVSEAQWLVPMLNLPLH